MTRLPPIAFLLLAVFVWAGCASPARPAAAPAGTPAPAAPASRPPTTFPTAPPTATKAPVASPTPAPAVSPTPTLRVSPSPVVGEPGVSAQATLAARQIAADTLGVAPKDVKVLSVTPMEWSDASLGCPNPDMMYAQVITPGYQAQVEVNGEVHDVHMDDKGHGVVCTQPQ